MSFLDILVKQKQETFNTAVHGKATNPGNCFNGRSECLQRHKDFTNGAYLRRALTHCSTSRQVRQEIERSTQVLNNGFNKDMKKRKKSSTDGTSKKKKEEKKKKPQTSKKDIKLYYKAYFSTAYKERWKDDNAEF